MYEYDDEETLYTIMGYNQVKYKVPYISVLLDMGVPLYNFTKCKGNYRASRVNITTTQIFAGYTDGSNDSCIRDSGGPIVIKDGFRYNSYGYYATYKLAGTVNYGIKCSEAKYSGIYLKVNRYIEWIKSATGRNWVKYTNYSKKI
jgi:secreted trypsin-like serine protease